ncbi:MAG: TIGR00730 family Rossman fold protein [Melioribacteraceae bacterium]|nr:TIGR00730 family Rossman fold protein [Melioribacteraceae bacterium]MCF8354786.1 TIGR00730 family Rossman fold protein [Melioribacteraceae bacterium]MCF8393320.1 TIGR00730 family Rossman fold protein [Melioribacteraceae bacterium]MCF8419172.1 TIGR00730 family Rossman fold protein [Melioribacteraceae bacterium]
MAKKQKPVKAYKNLDFLSSSDARTVRMLAEFYEPLSRFKKLDIVDTIVFFGSARISSEKEAKKELRKVKAIKNKNTTVYKEKLKRAERKLLLSKYYEDTVELSRRLTEWSMKLSTEQRRFIICSGGGPGIMEAANKGAYDAGGVSIGLNISIPFEQFVNKYVPPELAFEFHYFFMRKFWFIYLAKALIVFPGGFGTLDELMEVLTLSQTGKIKKEMKIFVYDTEYWTSIINFGALVEYQTISLDDLKLMEFCDTVDDAFEKITNHFSKFYANGNDRK